MKFADYSFLPVDRPYNFNQDGKITYPFSLGACSYSGEIEIDVAREHPSHLLVGRFCSFAGKIWFSFGNNHEYKNTVTTFPFGMDFVVERILNAAQIPPTNYIPVDKGILCNHYQTVVGNDVWIGQGATIRGGVKIGSGAIIGTNSMVTRDVPPYAIAAGNPARVVKYRFDAATIKKFMAVKWWNWSIEKIYHNFPQMRNADEFLAKHYTPELEHIQYEKIGGGGYALEEYRADGRQIYAFVADFRAPQPLWRRVISGFLRSNLKNAVLIFWLGNTATPADFEEVKQFAGTIGLTDGRIVHIIPPLGGRNFSPYLLRHSTHFITTREMVSVECLDWLYDTDVKIISALDEGIFSGEPEISWDKI